MHSETLLGALLLIRGVTRHLEGLWKVDAIFEKLGLVNDGGAVLVSLPSLSIVVENQHWNFFR